MSSEINYRAIRGYIQRGGFEGKSRHIGYIPPDEQDNSGVTIGVGFDLGHHNEKDLVKMGFSSRMISKLRPYLGKVGQAARNIRDKQPLILGPESNDYLESIMRPTKYYVDKLASKYDHATGTPGDFESLDPAIQGTLFSVLYQYGMTNPAKSTPKFWKHAVGKDWSGLVNELEKGKWSAGDEPRKKREASMLRSSGVLIKQSVIDQDGPHIGGYSK